MSDLSIALTGKNTFLSPKQAEKNNSAYFGEFLALKDFDDGWTKVMYEDFKKYVDTISEDGVDLKIVEEKNATLGKINVILKFDKLDEQNQEKIKQIKDDFLNIYNLALVEEQTTFALTKELDIDVEQKEFSRTDYGYERQAIQTQYAKLSFLKNQLENLKYQIDIQEKQEDELINKELNLGLLVNNKSNLEKLEKLITKIEDELPFLLELLYQTINLKNLGTKNNEIFIDIEKILGGNILKPLNLNGKPTDKIEEEQENNVDIAKSSKGIIGEFNLDKDGKIISAKNLETQNPIFKKDGKIYGYNFEGFSEINEILPIGIVDGKIISLEIKVGESYFYFNFENGKYNKINIQGLNSYTRILYEKLDQDGKIISGVVYITSMYDEALLYKENGEYKILKHEKEKINNFKYVKYNENYKPLYGLMKIINYEDIYFYLEEGGYKFIKVGYYCKEIYIDKYGKPFYYKDYNTIFYRNEDSKDENDEFIKKGMFQRKPYKNNTELFNLLEA